MNRLGKLWISLLSLIAIALSLWLTIEKLAGRIDTLAGCGAGSGCANVLGSKWSMVFGVIPVSVFSLMVYLGVLVSLWINKPITDRLRLLSAWLFLWAAVWFIALQLLILKTICPYCMTMHGLGAMLGVSILLLDKNLARRMVIPSLALVSSMAFIQHFGPEPATHRIEQQAHIEFTDTSTSLSQLAGPTAEFFDGKKTYELENLPHIGSPTAEHIIVKYFDYRCEACREVHEQLSSFMEKHPGKLAVILYPVPLNRGCNPYLPKGIEDHTNACELAELALKVWNADQTKFAEIHHTLFEIGELPIEAAEAMAYSLVGEEAMSNADQAWVNTTLKQGLEDYRAFSEKTPVMPKVLLKGSSLMQGKAKDQETFESILMGL